MLELVTMKSKIRHDGREEAGNDRLASGECRLDEPQGFYFTKIKEFAGDLPANTLLPVRDLKISLYVYALLVRET